MKWTIAIFLLLFCRVSYGQDFNLYYTTIGLGSNRDYPPNKEIGIHQQTMVLRTQFKSSDSTLTEYKVPDTTNDYHSAIYYNYMIEISQSDITKICALVDTLKNKRVICSNPNIMSGGMHKLLVKNNGFVTEFSLTNTFDSTALKIIKLLNKYLPTNNQIYYPEDLWKSNPSKGPLIKEYTTPSENSSSEAYGNTYDILIRDGEKRTKKDKLTDESNE